MQQRDIHVIYYDIDIILSGAFPDGVMHEILNVTFAVASADNNIYAIYDKMHTIFAIASFNDKYRYNICHSLC